MRYFYLGLMKTVVQSAVALSPVCVRPGYGRCREPPWLVVREGEPGVCRVLTVVRPPAPLPVPPAQPGEVDPGHGVGRHLPHHALLPPGTVVEQALPVPLTVRLDLRQLQVRLRRESGEVSGSRPSVPANSEYVHVVVHRVSLYLEHDPPPRSHTEGVAEALDARVPVSIDVPLSGVVTRQAVLSDDLISGGLAVGLCYLGVNTGDQQRHHQQSESSTHLLLISPHLI